MRWLQTQCSIASECPRDSDHGLNDATNATVFVLRCRSFYRSTSIWRISCSLSTKPKYCRYDQLHHSVDALRTMLHRNPALQIPHSSRSPLVPPRRILSFFVFMPNGIRPCWKGPHCNGDVSRTWPFPKDISRLFVDWPPTDALIRAMADERDHAIGEANSNPLPSSAPRM